MLFYVDLQCSLDYAFSSHPNNYFNDNMFMYGLHISFKHLIIFTKPILYNLHFQTHWTLQPYSRASQIPARAQATQYKVNANLLRY